MADSSGEGTAAPGSDSAPAAAVASPAPAEDAHASPAATAPATWPNTPGSFPGKNDKGSAPAPPPCSHPGHLPWQPENSACTSAEQCGSSRKTLVTRQSSRRTSFRRPPHQRFRASFSIFRCTAAQCWGRALQLHPWLSKRARVKLPRVAHAEQDPWLRSAQGRDSAPLHQPVLFARARRVSRRPLQGNPLTLCRPRCTRVARWDWQRHAER
jgi:hypothetical protein